MNRIAILDRIRIEPQTPQGKDLRTWTFFATMRKPRGGATVVTRRFSITFDPSARAFTGKGTRRVTKRKKRKTVPISKGMIAYLRTRLPPADIARCIAASIARPATASDPDARRQAFNSAAAQMSHAADAIGLLSLSVSRMGQAFNQRMRR